MTKNWSALNFYILMPTTIEEAVNRLLLTLTNDELQEVCATPKEDIFSLHFSLGISVRNVFGLHDPHSKLVARYPDVHPDDISMLIIHVLWQRLQNSSIECQ